MDHSDLKLPPIGVQALSTSLHGVAQPNHSYPGDVRSSRRAVPDRMERLSIEFGIYRVSQEERAKLREGLPYVKLYLYNPKHLYPKLNGFRDNGK